MTASEVGKNLACLLVALVHPMLQGVFSEHRPVLAAVPCLDKGQRGCLLVEQHVSCLGASWYLLPFGSFLPPTTWAHQTSQSQIHRLHPRSSCSTCQQARLSSCEYLVGRDLWKSLFQPPAQKRTIASAKPGQLWLCLAHT